MTAGLPATLRAVPPRAAIRVTAGVVVLLAVVATFADTASRGPVNPFNFFGFFTMQSNLMAAGVLLAAAVLEFRRRTPPAWFLPVRAAVATYMVVVGVVYNLLLTNIAGGVELPWANWVLHVAFPLYALADWLLMRDRHPLPFRVIRLILVYPLVWVAVVLVRGATDGWVPYPFLDPSTGYPSVLAYVVGIAVSFAAFGALIVLAGRVLPPNSSEPVGADG